MPVQRERIEQWIEAIGADPAQMPEGRARWHLVFNWAENDEMHVIGPADRPNAIQIKTETSLAPDHLDAFEKLSDGQRRDFLIGLERALNCVGANYRIEGIDHPYDCPDQFQTSVIRYEDGLSLDSFSRSVGAVYKTKLEGVLFVREQLEGVE